MPWKGFSVHNKSQCCATKNKNQSWTKKSDRQFLKPEETALMHLNVDMWTRMIDSNTLVCIILHFPQLWDTLMIDLFPKSVQLFTSQDINWCTGVIWITCGSLILILILTAPIHSRGLVGTSCNATFLQICSDEETNSSWDGLRLS